MTSRRAATLLPLIATLMLSGCVGKDRDRSTVSSSAVRRPEATTQQEPTRDLPVARSEARAETKPSRSRQDSRPRQQKADPPAKSAEPAESAVVQKTTRPTSQEPQKEAERQTASVQPASGTKRSGRRVVQADAKKVRPETARAEGPAAPLALLIGCTDYVDEQIPDLYGAYYDVRTLSEILVDKYGFPEDDEHMVLMTRRSARPDYQPTRKNIERQFEQIATQVTPGSEVVILLSGHGLLLPDDNDDEEDGFDEAFCPMDVVLSDEEPATGTIRDDELVAWVRGIADKGATVWLIADFGCRTGEETEHRFVRGLSEEDGSETPEDDQHDDFGQNVVAIHAGPPGQVVYESWHEVRRQGDFSTALSDALARPGTDPISWQALTAEVQRAFSKSENRNEVQLSNGTRQDTVLAGQRIRDGWGWSASGDPIVLKWGEMIRAGKAEQALESMTANIMSENPHSIVDFLWFRLMERLDRHDQIADVSRDFPPAIRDSVVSAYLYHEKRYEEMIDRWPPENVDSLRRPKHLGQLSNAAANLDDPEVRWKYVRRSMEVAPKSFDSTWDLILMGEYYDRFRKDILSLVATDTSLGQTAGGRLARDYLRVIPTVGTAEKLLLIERFLRSHPDDLYAQIFRSTQLTRLDHAEVKLSANAEINQKWPVLSLSLYVRPAKAMCRAGREDEVAGYLEQQLALFMPQPDDRRRWAAIYRSRALRETGDFGRALKVLEPALERFPNSSKLWAQKAALEEAQKPKDEAVAAAERACELDPDNGRYREIVARVLSDLKDDHAAALEVSNQAQSLTAVRSRSFYRTLAKIHQKRERSMEAIQTLEAALEHYPASSQLYLDLGKAWMEVEDPEKAKRALEMAVRLSPSSTAAADELQDLVRNEDGRDDEKALLATWREEYPHRPIGYRAREDAEEDEKIEIGRAAVGANPGRDWANRLLVNALVAADRFDEAESVTQQYLAVARVDNEADYIDAVFWRAELVLQHLNRKRLSPEVLQEGLERWERFRQAGGFLGTFHWGVAETYTALGQEAQAGKAWMATTKLRPDSYSPHWTLVAHHKAAVGSGRAFWQMARYVDRRPFDAERIKALIQLHVMWTGSPISTLMYTQRLRAFAPGEVSTFHEGMAWGKLGDDVRDYRARYLNRSVGPGLSDRYQEWYDRARLAAQQARKHVTIDYETGIATTVHPNGLVVKRQDDLETGQPLRWDVGAAWIKIEYTAEEGKLARIEDSAGSWFKLTYDDANEVSTMASSDGDSLQFEYDEAGQLIQIDAEGVGTVQMTYDADGELQKVESEGGSQVALQVTRVIRELQEIAQRATGTSSNPPSLPWHDEKLDELIETARSDETQDSVFAYVEYLVEHVGDTKDHARNARRMIYRLLSQLESQLADTGSDDGSTAAMQHVQATRLLQELNLKTRTAGLADDDWTMWCSAVDRVEKTAQTHQDAAGNAAREFLAELTEDGTTLLSAARWLPRSELVNPGFWHRTPWHLIVPRHLADKIQPRCVLARQNGNVVVATTHGVAVRERGFWTFRGYDPTTGGYHSNRPPAQEHPEADVYCLFEDADERLWVGSGGGLLCLPQGDEKSVRKFTASDGLPNNRVEQIERLDDRLVLGTSAGPAIGTMETGFEVVSSIQRPVRFLTPFHPEDQEEESLLVGTDQAVWILSSDGHASNFVERAFVDMRWYPPENRLVGLSRDTVLSAVIRPDKTLQPDDFRPIPGQQDIVRSQQLHGLAAIRTHDYERGISVLTDQGVSIYENRHIEHLDLPAVLADRRVGVRQLVASPLGESLYAVTDQGFFAFERDQAWTDQEGPVADLQHVPGRGVFVARESALQWIPKGAESIEDDSVLLPLSANVLDADEKGTLYFASHSAVGSWEADAERHRTLFPIHAQTVDGEFPRGPVRDVLAASDGTVWAAAGPSVFRYREDMDEAEEFSFFKDSDAFPSYTHMIHRIHETPNGKIWVVCSDESHLKYNGTPLRGGLLHYDPEDNRFERVDIDQKKDPWFFHAMTQIDDRTAIAADFSGFCRLKDGRMSQMRSLNDPTYTAVRNEHRMLWNGTEGVRVGPADQTDPPYLFGTAGGLVGYRAGRWFVPQRLNWLLPAPHLADYGARAISAVACDAQGRIYAGTDQGLLVFETGGDIMDCLTLDTQHELAFSEQERQQLSEQADVMLDAIPEDSETGRQIAEVQSLRREIEGLEQQTTGTTMPSSPTRSKPLTGADERPMYVPETTPRAFDLAQRLQEKQKRYRALILKIEKEHRGLYQMLELKPLDLAALRKQLSDGQVIVQYLPTPKTLHIQVVSSSEVTVRSVHVSSKELFQQATAAASALRKPLTPANEQLTLARLSWLYESLLRPVESEINTAQQVFLVRTGSLTYLPFGALIREAEPERHYAIEHFNFGYLPTMYLLDLVLRDTPSESADALVATDPNGDLPGARAEGRTVCRLLKASRQPLEGTDVTVANLFECCADTGVIHLATHGVLNPKNPAESYLEMARGERLSVLEMMDLPLQGTDLAVLSACQSGIGGRGLEYATLARALAHAGVPSIIATMWNVPDKESRQLMEKFYRKLPENHDVFRSLADAKRLLIKSGYADQPHTWAGYVAFGKPGFELATSGRRVRQVSRSAAK